MPLPWDAASDFAQIVDGLSSLSLYRRDCQDASWTRSCWRFSHEDRALPGLGDAVRRLEAEWHVPTGEDEEPPMPGDTLVDGTKGRFTVVAVDRLRSATRYLCLTQRTQIAPGYVGRYDIEQPLVETSPEGPVTLGWRVVRPAVRGYVARALNEETAGSDTYEMLTEDTVAAEIGYRVVSHRGLIYEVKGSPIFDPSRGLHSVALAAVSLL